MTKGHARVENNRFRFPILIFLDSSELRRSAMGGKPTNPGSELIEMPRIFIKERWNENSKEPTLSHGLLTMELDWRWPFSKK